MNAKPFRIRFDKLDGAIKIYDGIRYLELSISYNEVYYGINYRIYNANFDRINYLISEKMMINIVLIITLQESTFFTDRKKLTFHNVIILIKSVLHKNKNN